LEDSPAAGLYFKREWCAVVDEVPADLDLLRRRAELISGLLLPGAPEVHCD